MRILIAGASGFIGQALVKHFSLDHSVTVLGRDLKKLNRLFPNESIKKINWTQLPLEDAHAYDAIINLCGEPIAQKRWTKAFKKTLIDSRVHPTLQLLKWLTQAQAHPHWIQANAIGIYGLQSPNDPQALDEDSIIELESPQDYLSVIATQWQAAAEPALKANIPLTITRFGVVLHRRGGMLKQLYPSFLLGLGSVLGHGQQMISWIHLEDLVRAIDYLIHHPKITGPINLTAPEPVTQKKLAQTLAKSLHRPLWLTLPAWLIQGMFGEMGQLLLLSGQRVVPKRLQQLNFKFRYPSLEQAIQQEFN